MKEINLTLENLAKNKQKYQNVGYQNNINMQVYMKQY